MQEEEKQMIQDLIWLNALIATELIQITENSSAILRKGDIPISCLTEHRVLREMAVRIAEKYHPDTMLGQHVLKHQ
jgi:hypothetical protein